MKYCNLNCKHINASIIERCGEGVGYEFRCMAQNGMPKVTTGTFCPYDEISETKIDELKVYKKALELACNEIRDRNCGYYHFSDSCKSHCELYEVCEHNIEFENYFLQKAREE